ECPAPPAAAQVDGSVPNLQFSWANRILELLLQRRRALCRRGCGYGKTSTGSFSSRSRGPGGNAGPRSEYMEDSKRKRRGGGINPLPGAQASFSKAVSIVSSHTGGG